MTLGYSHNKKIFCISDCLILINTDTIETIQITLLSSILLYMYIDIKRLIKVILNNDIISRLDEKFKQCSK